jgi:glycine betaine/proline transport system substrate-binding protein
MFPRRATTVLGAALAAATGLTLSACSSGGAAKAGSAGGGQSSKTINIGYISWDENVANSYLWKELLEEQGYKVNLNQLEVAALYSGVAQGQLDIFMAATPKTHSDYWQRFDKKFTVLGQWYDTLSQSVAVPDYTGLKTMDDLKGKSNEFNGEIVGIEAGSGLMRQLHDNAVKDYDLSGYKILDGSTPAMLAALDKAIKAKKPIAVTLWQPHWAFSKYPMVLLEDPKGSFGGNDVYKTIASKQFADGNKKVADELAKFHMTPEQLQSLELKISEAGQGKEQAAAKAWIGENESVVKAWTGGN